jgi:hypothetical protein
MEREPFLEGGKMIRRVWGQPLGRISARVCWPFYSLYLGTRRIGVQIYHAQSTVRVVANREKVSVKSLEVLYA